MLNEFIDFIEQNALYNPKQKVLLGVSGGVDSMVMLHLFKQSGFEFAVAHCNFTLRGKDSDLDEQFVLESCKSINVECYSKRFDTEAYATEHGISIQVAARNLRYQWFKQLCQQHSFGNVAVAHNKNDVAETMLINLTRGTGLKGLTGIQAKSNGVIRPLLFAQRKRIEAYAQEQNIRFREDITNANTKYIRNRIRHNVISELEQINPDAVNSLYATSLILTDVWNEIEAMHSLKSDSLRLTKGEEIWYFIPELKQLPFMQLYLLQELNTLGFSPASVEQIVQSLDGEAGKIFLAPKHQLVKDREHLILAPRGAEDIQEVSIDSPQQRVTYPVNISFDVVEQMDGFRIPQDKAIGAFDIDKITFPMVLRPWQQGDWFIPFGMKGRKKLSDFLIDQKVPLHQKDSVYVLLSENKIVWVVGYRIDNRFRIDAQTQRVLTISLKEKA